MTKNSEFQELNADDRRLIAEKACKSKKTVDAVLRGIRKNPTIILCANELLAKKEELKTEFLNEQIAEAITNF